MRKLKLKKVYLPLAIAVGIGGILAAKKLLPKGMYKMGQMMGRMMEQMPDE